MRVYIHENGGREGPVELAKLRQDMNAGVVSPRLRVSPKGQMERKMTLAQALQMDPASRPAQSFDPGSMDDAPNKPRGCLGCLGSFLGVLLVLLLAAHIVIWHTPVPLRILASLSTNDRSVRIGSISGSLARGARVEDVQITDEHGNISRIGKAGIRHNSPWDMYTRRRIVIRELYVQQAHIFYSPSPGTGDPVDRQDPPEEPDASGTEPEKPDASGTESREPDAADTGDEPFDFPSWLDRIAIGRVELTDVVLEDRDSGDTVEVASLTLEDLELTPDQFSLGPIALQSSHLDFRMEPATFHSRAAETLQQPVVLSGVLKPEKFDTLRDPLAFSVHLDLHGSNVERGEFRLYDDAVILRLASKDAHTEGTLMVQDLDLQRYHPDWYVTALSIDATFVQEDKGERLLIALSGGGFEMGRARFTVDATELELTEHQTEPVILTASAPDPGADLRMSISPEAATMSDIVFSLVARDGRSLQALLSDMLFGLDEEALTDEQREIVMRQAERLAIDARYHPPE